MTGRPGHRTMEMTGGSSAPYLACTPCVPLFCSLFNRGGNRRAFSLPGAGGGSFPLYGGTFARSYSVSTDPDTLKSIAIHLPFLSRYFCKSMPSSWQKVVYTPPVCITIRLPFVSRYFCRSIRVGVVGTPPILVRVGGVV